MKPRFFLDSIAHSHRLSADLQNAVKIKRGKETIIYRTDKAEDKKVLLLAFKKVAEDLMNKRRKEMLNEAEARKGDVRAVSCADCGL